MIDLTCEADHSLAVLYFPLINVAPNDNEENVPLILMAEAMDEITDKEELRDNFKIVALFNTKSIDSKS